MRRQVVVVVALALTAAVACYKRRDVVRGDWGAIPQDNHLVVRTLEGNSHELDHFVFTTTALVGVRNAISRGAAPDSARIPIDSIVAVRASQLDKPATLMLTAAATTAAFVLVGLTQSTFRPEPVPRPPVSCPFVYSWDGSTYVLDSETYSGAIARALERRDVDNLEHLRPVRGRYRIRMRNERPETEYTDELTLLVTDHPTGTRAIPDVAGVVRIVRDERRALSVREFGGDSLPSRTGQTMTFAPPARDSLALVLRVRNTPLAAFALGQVLDLLGSGVYGFYRSMQQQPATRATVLAWMDREGSLEVQLGAVGSESWTTVARIADVGPMVAKSVVVPLPAGLAHDSLRIRLESSPGLWVVESATLATYVGDARVRAIAPSAARDVNGQDVTALLDRRDHRYFVALQGRDVDVEYAAPAIAAGTTRSVLLQSTGHYYIDTPDTARARADVVQRLLMDRGFAQRYFADAWVRAGGAPVIPAK